MPLALLGYTGLDEYEAIVLERWGDLNWCVRIDFLWLLSKNPNDQVSDFTDALAKMKKQGFETDQLIVNSKRMK